MCRVSCSICMWRPFKHCTTCICCMKLCTSTNSPACQPAMHSACQEWCLLQLKHTSHTTTELLAGPVCKIVCTCVCEQHHMHMLQDALQLIARFCVYVFRSCIELGCRCIAAKLSTKAPDILQLPCSLKVMCRCLYEHLHSCLYYCTFAEHRL